MFRDILYLRLIVNGKQVDTSVCGLNHHIEGDDSEFSTLAAALTLNTKAYLMLATSKVIANLRVLQQLLLQVFKIVWQRTVAFGQAFAWRSNSSV